MQITHPHHPLAGQRVRVVRQTGSQADRQWVIQLPDQTCARIPLSWAVPDDPSPPPETNPPAPDLWADVTGLLTLARMVRSLCVIEPTEVTSDETTADDASGGAHDSARTKHRTPALGDTAIGRAPGNNDSIGSDDGQAAAGPEQTEGRR